MVSKSSGRKFPEGIVKKINDKRFKYAVFILRTIYQENRIYTTWAEVTKAANRRVMKDRLDGKSVLKIVRGKRIAVYEKERSYDTLREANSYAMGPHGKMPMR
jgi:hypothetical protein